MKKQSRIKVNVRATAQPSRFAHLRLSPNYELEVTIPRQSKVDAETILRKKRKWIENKVEELSTARRVFDGKRLLYRGKYHTVGNSQLNNVKVRDGQILLPRGADTNGVLKEWMTEQTSKYLRLHAATHAENLGVNFRELHVRDSNKWGYCTKEGDLVFNWQLIALPRDLSDFVILHELVHLSKFDHSRNFKARLAAVCPDFEEKQRAMRNILPMRVSG